MFGWHRITFLVVMPALVAGIHVFLAASLRARRDRGRERRLVSLPPPSEPDVRISRIYSRWHNQLNWLDKFRPPLRYSYWRFVVMSIFGTPPPNTFTNRACIAVAGAGHLGSARAAWWLGTNRSGAKLGLLFSTTTRTASLCPRRARLAALCIPSVRALSRLDRETPFLPVRQHP